jgi:hypothetical protein
MPTASPTYDASRKRPLELRIRDLRDQGGQSEEEARRFSQNRFPADALYVIRAMIDEGAIALQHISIVAGEENSQMGIDMLFNMWISLGGYLAREGLIEPGNEDHQRKRRFVQSVLFKLRVDTAFVGLQAGLSPEDAMAAAEGMIPSGPTEIEMPRPDALVEPS